MALLCPRCRVRVASWANLPGHFRRAHPGVRVPPRLLPAAVGWGKAVDALPVRVLSSRVIPRPGPRMLPAAVPIPWCYSGGREAWVRESPQSQAAMWEMAGGYPKARRMEAEKKKPSSLPQGDWWLPVLLAIVAVVILIALGHERKLAAASASKLAPLVSGHTPEA